MSFVQIGVVELILQRPLNQGPGLLHAIQTDIYENQVGQIFNDSRIEPGALATFRKGLFVLSEFVIDLAHNAQR